MLLNGRSYVVVAEKSDAGYRLLVNGRQLLADVESERTKLLKQFESQKVHGTTKLEIRAPMPALVVKVEVGVGDEVKAGQGLVILEAMKMENEIKAHSSGKVKEIHITKGTPVEKGQLLLILE
jgi:pyruvate carboxylase subunit B